MVLEAGEYIVPLLVDRQGPENKWPDRWKQWIRDYPNALTTYLKPSETVVPFRVEAFESVPNIEPVLDLILHTSRLLPSYGFPVGLDIVDKFAKVPCLDEPRRQGPASGGFATKGPRKRRSARHYFCQARACG